MRRVIAPLAIVMACAVAACSSENTNSMTGSTTAPTATTMPADPATTLAPGTSMVPASTAPATTPQPTTPPASGWTPIDPSTLGAPLAFPCCGSNWYGAGPSPALPSAGGYLADGVYRIDFEWPTTPGGTVTATVSRFESCNVLPAGICEDNGGGTYAADEMGVDPAGTVELTFTLDGSLGVVLGGFTGGDTGNFAAANGADMAALIGALDSDYQMAVLDAAAAGMSADDIVAALTASPAYGFSAPPVEYSGVLTYSYAEDAPPLLFQMLPGVNDGAVGARGSNVVGPISLIVEEGRYTVVSYAGFYS